VAEVIFAAGIELDVGRQLVAEFGEKAVQSAEMIEVPVAHDQRADLRRIHLQDFDVVEERVRAVAEIEERGALVVALLGFEQQRKAPLVMQRAAIIFRSTCTDRRHAVHFLTAQENVVGAVEQNPDGQLVHHGRRNRRRVRDFEADEVACCRNTSHRSRTFQKVAPPH